MHPPPGTYYCFWRGRCGNPPPFAQKVEKLIFPAGSCPAVLRSIKGFAIVNTRSSRIQPSHKGFFPQHRSPRHSAGASVFFVVGDSRQRRGSGEPKRSIEKRKKQAAERRTARKKGAERGKREGESNGETEIWRIEAVQRLSPFRKLEK